jgi:hypothetical protein
MQREMACWRAAYRAGWRAACWAAAASRWGAWHWRSCRTCRAYKPRSRWLHDLRCHHACGRPDPHGADPTRVRRAALDEPDRGCGGRPGVSNRAALGVSPGARALGGQIPQARRTSHDDLAARGRDHRKTVAQCRKLRRNQLFERLPI